VKHTYLYPLPAPARFLWRVGRADAVDLFGESDPFHQGGILRELRLSDEFDHARRVVFRLIKNSPRVCIGQGYVIPGSLRDDGGKHHAVQPSTESLTETFWDAPLVTARLAHEVTRALYAELDRDPVPDIRSFLNDHVGQHVIPVWM